MTNWIALYNHVTSSIGFPTPKHWGILPYYGPIATACHPGRSMVGAELNNCPLSNHEMEQYTMFYCLLLSLRNRSDTVSNFVIPDPCSSLTHLSCEIIISNSEDRIILNWTNLSVRWMCQNTHRYLRHILCKVWNQPLKRAYKIAIPTTVVM